MSGKDPFADFGLPEDPTAAPGSAAPSPSAESTSATPSPARPAQPSSTPAAPVRWETVFFETQSLPGPKRCEQCSHFVPGGALAIDQIYELRHCDELVDFSLEARESGWEYERRELEEIIEKSRTLDDKYDQPPRVKAYCAVDVAQGGRTYRIPEIKNHDGHCADHQLGSRPWVKCEDCRHIRPVRVTEPSRADYRVNLDEYGSLLHDPDFPVDTGMLRGAYDRQDRQYELRTREYAARLKEDASSVAYGDGDVENGTIDECGEFYKACAVINRSNRCPSFEGKMTPRPIPRSTSLLAGTVFGVSGLSGSPARSSPPSEGDRMASQRASDEYSEALVRRHAAEAGARPRPPCYDCAHRRDPVAVDPFREVHRSGREIMDLRTEYRRARQQQVQEERRLMTGPGDGLGDVEPPSQHLWCDKHSRRAASGRILEYAYCFRVLKALAPTGKCPSFSPRSAQTAADATSARAAPAAPAALDSALQGLSLAQLVDIAKSPTATAALGLSASTTETDEERWRRQTLAEHEAKRQRKERGRTRRPRP